MIVLKFRWKRYGFEYNVFYKLLNSVNVSSTYVFTVDFKYTLAVMSTRDVWYHGKNQ